MWNYDINNAEITVWFCKKIKKPAFVHFYQF